jgi:chromosome segregation ATPase
MDAAMLQEMNDEDSSAGAQDGANPMEDIHTRIATAFAGPAEQGEFEAACDVVIAFPINEISGRYARAVEGRAEAVSQSQQSDRQEMGVLKEALRDLCNATISFSSHTEQRFSEILGKLTTIAGRQEFADKSTRDSENRLAMMAIDHAVHTSHIELTDRTLKDFEGKQAAWASAQAAQATRQEATDRNLRDIESKLATLAAGYAAQANELEMVRQRLADSNLTAQRLAKQLETAQDRLSDLGEPVEFLRQQNAELTNNQRDFRKTLELILERSKAARESEVQFEQRISATEQKIVDSVERIESVSRWQSRIGMALSASPR